MKDIHNNIKVSRAISPVSVSDNTVQVSQIIDTQGFNALEFLIAIGSVADADATFTVLLEDGDDAALSDAAAVADAELLGTEPLPRSSMTMTTKRAVLAILVPSVTCA
ncbi:MAG: hypothetical protein KDD76_01950 [Rickettsiales bacterium]|nr:hypothetical protein [Rickettsiales bacterium]